MLLRLGMGVEVGSGEGRVIRQRLGGMEKIC
jgi:hypothetical protein